jgi:hypothetical protein
MPIDSFPTRSPLALSGLEDRGPASDNAGGNHQPLALLGALPRHAAPIPGSIVRSERGLVPNISLSLDRSDANYAASALGADLNIRDRGAALTFAIPGTGLFYRVELNSRRVQAFAPAARNKGRLGVVPGVLAMSVAAFLSAWMLAGRGSPAGTPQVAAAEIPASAHLASSPVALPQAPRAGIVTPPPDKREVQQVAAPHPIVLARATPAAPQAVPPGLAGTQTPNAAASQPDSTAPVEERVATNKTANIKVTPDAAAQVVRVVPARVILTVFSRKDDWLEVGSTYAWGWVHASFVNRYVPRN